MNMDAKELLEFSDDWLTLGIVTASELEELRQQYEIEQDQNKEHYRWRAFRVFLASQPSIDEGLAKALYRLGESDPDGVMGGSMMRAILLRHDCPNDLLQIAADAEQDFLTKIARRRLEEG